MTVRADPLVEIEDLSLSFHTGDKPVQALRGVDLTIREGETLGLVGESGCGKSQTALSLLKLNPIPPGRYEAGHVNYHRPTPDGTGREWVDVLEMPEEDLLDLRGGDITMVFQDPTSSLNPVLTVGDQVTETIVQHRDVGHELKPWDRWLLRRGLRSPGYRKAQKAAKPIAVDLLDRAGIPDPDTVVDRYPHELSGGMRQRVMIAIALASEPDLLVADEPTTALDVTIQAQILDLMSDLQERTSASILLITHDLGVVAEMADRVAVMYAGEIVEQGPAEDVYHEPKHPYTLGLLDSIPDVDGPDGDALPEIPGTVPDMEDPPSGCSFHPRCPFAEERCRREEPALQAVEDQQVACHLHDPGHRLPEALRRPAEHGFPGPEETPEVRTDG